MTEQEMIEEAERQEMIEEWKEEHRHEAARTKRSYPSLTNISDRVLKSLLREDLVSVLRMKQELAKRSGYDCYSTPGHPEDSPELTEYQINLTIETVLNVVAESEEAAMAKVTFWNENGQNIYTLLEWYYGDSEVYVDSDPSIVFDNLGLCPNEYRQLTDYSDAA